MCQTTQAENYLIFCPEYDVTDQVFQKFGLALGNRCALYACAADSMKGTKVQTLGVRAVAGVCMIIMAVGAIINTHAHR